MPKLCYASIAIIAFCVRELRSKHSCPTPAVPGPEHKDNRLMLPIEHCQVMNIPLDVLKDLKDNQVRSLAGNAMHAAALSAVLLYIFTCAERIDANNGGENIQNRFA